MRSFGKIAAAGSFVVGATFVAWRWVSKGITNAVEGAFR